MRFASKIIFSAFSILAFSHSPAAAQSSRPLFASSEVISLSLSGPLYDLSRRPDAKPAPGVLKIAGPAPESLPVLLSTRGVTRRRKDICEFPPLRVEFDGKPGKASLFKGQHSLKLVTHCQIADRYEQYVLLEYASYRLYQALTPESFDVRLAKIDYVDENGRAIATRMGFFIEDIDDVAERNGQKRFKGVTRINAAQLAPEAAARFAVFQYMISNLDWAMTLASPDEGNCCHNSRLMGVAGSETGLITVPYDFDYGGLVDAPYAVPPESSHLSDVPTRQYRGFCRTNPQAQAFAASLSPRRTELLALVDHTPGLNERSRAKADAYLGAFFDQIATPAGITAMLKTCLG